MPERKVLQMTQKQNNSRHRDSSSKLIFSDPILCTQFFRDYVDIPMLKNIQPEDIEDVTHRFVHMFTEERDSDSVKKIHVKTNETPFYLISLIEHKSDVDYNVVMQVFRYMSFIWEDYEKEMEQKQKGITKRKNFKYPPILPIVFYDGTDNWTAATKLHDRILFSDVFGKYIPDYQCILVQLKDYSNEELMKKRDELSIIMMVDRLKNAADFVKLREEVDANYLTEMTSDSPEYLLKLMQQIIEVFLEKLNIPSEEVDIFTEQIKERKMGELFAHFEGWDVHAIRKEAREEAMKEEREEAQREIREAKEKMKTQLKEEMKTQLKEEVKEKSIAEVIRVMKKLNVSKDVAKEQLVEEYAMSENEAQEKIEKYWQM